MNLMRTTVILTVLATTLASASASADAAPVCHRLAVALVVDRSGSMAGHSIDNAKAAATGAIDKLGPNDCVSVIAFDSQPQTVVTMHALSDPGVVKSAIARIQAGGGTEILSALDAAHRSLLSAPTASKKHVVLLTDGMSPTAGLKQLATTMSGEHMTLTTVGVGTDTDEQLLKDLSSTANGRYYRVADVTTLPRIFAREIDLALAP